MKTIEIMAAIVTSHGTLKYDVGINEYLVRDSLHD
jgi:hypothetical protein